MEAFLKQRRSDPRFNQGTIVPNHTSSAIGGWYRNTAGVVTERYTFNVAGGYETSMKKNDTDKADRSEKKKKKRKSGEAFSEGEKKKLENRTSSDDSDGGPCWVSIFFFVLFVPTCVLTNAFVRSRITNA